MKDLDLEQGLATPSMDAGARNPSPFPTVHLEAWM